MSPNNLETKLTLQKKGTPEFEETYSKDFLTNFVIFRKESFEKR